MSDAFNPTQWLRRTDPRTRRVYYVHRRTGRSTWDPAHRTARDTEPSAAALSHAVVAPVDEMERVVEVNAASIDAEPRAAADALVDSAPSSQVASEGASAADVAPTSDETPSAQQNATPSGISENEQVPSPAPAVQHASPPPAPHRLVRPAGKGAVPFECRVPLSVPASLSALSEGRGDDTPLSTSLEQPARRPQGERRRSGALGAATSTPPPPAEETPLPLSSSSSYLHMVPSPLQQDDAAVSSPRDGEATKAASTTSLSSTQTQRPSDQAASHPFTSTPNNVGTISSSSTIGDPNSSQHAPLLAVDAAEAVAASSSVLPPPPPPLPLPALVDAAAPHSAIAPRASALIIDSLDSAASSLSLPRRRSSVPAAAEVAGPDADQEDAEAAATEEWQLTQRTWELEGERARLESELAVLRGPVEVETQSIAEEHERLLAAQRALDAAATLAVQQQRGKREELEGLRGRLSELREQRRNAAFLLSTLQQRVDVLTERGLRVQDEEAALQAQRRELEEAVLPGEETTLREAQHRLHTLRCRVAGQRQQVEECEAQTQESAREVMLLKQRLEEMEALAVYDDTVAAPTAATRPNVLASAASKENEWPTTRLHGSAPGLGHDAGALVNHSAVASAPDKKALLPARIAALQREVDLLQAAFTALSENAVMAVQQRVLCDVARQTHSETELWRPVMDDARLLSRELRAFEQAQRFKYRAWAGHPDL